ncbi:MAG: Ig-like domain-containing protein [Clostridia bacterium]
MKKQLAILLAVVLLLLSGCGGFPPKQQTATESGQPQNNQTTTADTETLSLYPAAVNLPIGRELKLKATLSPEGACATWESSDEAVATVDDSGKIIAKAPGECTVTVTSGRKSAACTVLVEEDCRTVIFSTKPIKGDGENPPQPPKSGEPGEPPIELPPDVTDVAKIPESDEFVWTLEFDETYATIVTNDDLPLIVDVTISFKAEKQGGKTGIGSYTGIFSGDADIDKEHFIKVMNEQITDEGGKLTDYTENDEGLQETPVTVEVTAMDDAAYHEVMIGHIPEKDRSVTQQLPIPISDLFPGSMMVLDEVSGMVTISGTMTMEAMGQSITAPFGAAESSAQAYTICIYPSGDAVLTFPLMARDGFNRNWVEGMLTKRPLV